MFPTQGIDFIGKELKQENERMGFLNYECNFQCSPLPCDNQELGIITVHDSECDKTVPTNDEPCKTNVFGWFLNVDQAGAPGPASTSGPHSGSLSSLHLLRQYLEPKFVSVAALGLPLLWVCAGPQQSGAPSDIVSSLGATACSKVSSGHTSP